MGLLLGVSSFCVYFQKEIRVVILRLKKAEFKSGKSSIAIETEISELTNSQKMVIENEFGGSLADIKKKINDDVVAIYGKENEGGIPINNNGGRNISNELLRENAMENLDIIQFELIHGKENLNCEFDNYGSSSALSSLYYAYLSFREKYKFDVENDLRPNIDEHIDNFKEVSEIYSQAIKEERTKKEVNSFQELIRVSIVPYLPETYILR